MTENTKLLIGVLASHDSKEKNKELAELFADLFTKDKDKLEKFHFVFTGGTFDRIIIGSTQDPAVLRIPQMHNAYLIPDVNARNLIKRNSTRLPAFVDGGVTILANLFVQRQCHIIWPFLSPVTTHWLNPENLALVRLCDIWKDKRMMTSGSVKDWFEYQANEDAKRNLQKTPLILRSESDPGFPELTEGIKKENKDHLVIELPPGPSLEKSIALIAHDEMKPRMIDFAIEFESVLADKFIRILTTGTTGREILSATRKLKDKIRLCRSGPKGGDIEIATEVLFRRVHAVIFFIDPLRPHAHIDDVRSVFSACLRRPEVLLLTNEVHAREWIRTI